MLNHKEGTIRGVAAVCNRHAYLDERRRALEAWEALVLGLAAKRERDDSGVVELASYRS